MTRRSTCCFADAAFHMAWHLSYDFRPAFLRANASALASIALLSELHGRRWTFDNLPEKAQPNYGSSLASA
ncbi:hypothetical protein B0H11DRAFT_2231207 [Mycena galericulata]|nr:hypothetical protein B0H11DRAFT_2231207 [Mycena galericulata]